MAVAPGTLDGWGKVFKGEMPDKKVHYLGAPSPTYPTAGAPENQDLQL